MGIEMGIEKMVSRLCHDEANRYLRVKARPV
jgi:hypothetical protein